MDKKGKPEQQNSRSCRCECPAMTQEARERSPPTQSVESFGKVNPEAPGWTKRRYADKPSDNVVKPETGMSFDSQGTYDFYNLYSWELGFGIRYGKSDLNVELTKGMQEIVCGCSGRPEQQNSRSCRCECPAMFSRMGLTRSRKLKGRRSTLQDTTMPTTVIDYVGVTQIPKRHILKRWTKNARDILAQHLAHFQRDQAVNRSFICRSSILYLDAMHGAG
uniref:Protein FAR1-RELATED SEQUENCE n=1 Tax=Aegilops tauschii TaxID=37682 RepID=M8C1V0_AEGTA